MNWEHKLNAMKAICDVHLKMRKPGDWYVVARDREVKKYGSCILAHKCGNGSSPRAAVEDDWRQLVTELPDDHFIVINAGSDNRRHYRWNGTAWKEI